MRRFILGLLLFSSLSLNAALPPLSQEHREAYASDIVSGKVMKITVLEKTKFEHFVDYIYDAEIEVADVTKSDGSWGGLLPGQIIHVHYWKQKERPRGWAGPGGQYHLMEEGMDVQAYMFRDSAGALRLLEPNGSDNLALNKDP